MGRGAGQGHGEAVGGQDEVVHTDARVGCTDHAEVGSNALPGAAGRLHGGVDARQAAAVAERVLRDARAVDAA